MKIISLVGPYLMASYLKYMLDFKVKYYLAMQGGCMVSEHITFFTFLWVENPQLPTTLHIHVVFDV